MQFIHSFILTVSWISIFYTSALWAVYFLQLLSAEHRLKRNTRRNSFSDHGRYLDSRNMIPASLLVPAYNEEMTIVDTLKNLLTLSFPEYEIILINDGSSDATMERVQEFAGLEPVHLDYSKQVPSSPVKTLYRSSRFPQLLVADKENAGKADALNTGINLSRYPVIVSIDADSLLEQDALLKLVHPFTADHTLAACGGIIRAAGTCRLENGVLTQAQLPNGFLGKLQNVEYLRAFYAGRIGADALESLLIISGAFGAFRKSAVIRAGGYLRSSIGEDMELVVRLHRTLREEKSVYSIRFLSDPICWTQPPHSLKDLYRQRKRWQIGLRDTLHAHAGMLFRRSYGRIGMLTLPYYWIFEYLGPVFETLGYFTIPLSYFLGLINLPFLAGYFGLLILLGSILTAGSLLMHTAYGGKPPTARLLSSQLFYSLIDNLGYRQLLTVFRCAGNFSLRRKHKWGHIERRKYE